MVTLDLKPLWLSEFHGLAISQDEITDEITPKTWEKITMREYKSVAKHCQACDPAGSGRKCVRVPNHIGPHCCCGTGGATLLVWTAT